MRDTILIVDDEELNRELLAQIFSGDYSILMAENGQEAIEKFELYHERLAAILLDIVMPVNDGFHVLQELRANKKSQMEFVPVIMITANTDSDAAMRCYSTGAIEIIYKPFVASEVKQRVRNMIELYSSREKLKKKLDISKQQLAESEAKLEKFNCELVEAISDIIEFRDMESGQHVKRVKGLTRILGEAYQELYPEAGLTPEWIQIIESAAALHDIGKITIPDHILLKPGRLTPEERSIMETHTTKGCEVLAKLEGVQDTVHYRIAYEIVRHHHERYDGNGYPDKLKGDEIPISAQLVSVADVYDALTSDRVYKKAFSKEKAYQMIQENACGVFDPKLMRSMERCRERFEQFIDSTREQGECKVNYGEIVDIPSAKERFMGNYALFAKFLFQFPSRSLYGELEQALDSADAAKGFEIAHTMKGVVGNLSLKLISEPLLPMVEVLRGGALPDAAAREALKSAYNRTVSAIEQLKASGTALF